jgi:hypothetical protein
VSESGLDYERLGVFYLGRAVDPANLATSAQPLLYDSRDLVTHAAIVGMTGSGKTGLGIAMLEEAAIDGLPALVVDPKGDLADLLLTFPDLRPDDFLPWVRADEAERKGVSREQLAASEAAQWKRGLADWGQAPDRIRRLRDAAEVVLYTPGSELARPVSILSSFAAPPAAVLEDTDLFRDRVETAATSLLALAGVDADPLKSREHILVSTLLSEAWRAGRDLDLAALIGEIQKPPVPRVGVLDLETFYPSADRFALALRLNNLLAAPGFDVWTKGEPLKVEKLLHADTGRPRLAVLSIAHLSDAERMFFVSLLLNETVSWMRAQSGTSSLRALLYMDEVFGFLPPVANPPAKKPMLTLLKQARAYGLGLVLATQNPVDLDYKALSNMGTWCLGRLSTERDKARVLDGLESAAAGGFDRSEMDHLLSNLRPRLFVLRNVHDEHPILFESRWVMSYLAGPLDREGIRRLSAEGGKASTEGQDGPGPARSGAAAEARGPIAAAAPFRAATSADASGAAGPAAARPVLSPGISEVFVAPPLARNPSRYRPMLLGMVSVFFSDPRSGVEESVERSLVAEFGTLQAAAWDAARPAGITSVALETVPRPGVAFMELPAAAADARWYPRWEKALADRGYREERLRLFRSPTLAETSRAGEAEKDFRVRCSQLLRERRDGEMDKVRARYGPQLARIQDQIARAQDRVGREKAEASTRTVETAVSVGASVLGALFGRKLLSTTNISRAGYAARSATRAVKERGDVERAEDSLATALAAKTDLEARLQADLAAVSGAVDPASIELATVELRPRRSDVQVKLVALAWMPEDEAGAPLWT